MKRLFMSILLLLSMVTVSIKACQEECKTKCGSGKGINRIAYMMHNFGQALEDVPVPIFDKLGNILPFAVIAFSFKKFPKQILAVCGLSLLYYLYASNAIAKLTKRNKKTMFGKKVTAKASALSEFDDSFFNIEDEANNSVFPSNDQKISDNIFGMKADKPDTVAQSIRFL